eukprot:scaffold7422_cov49-Tisochrysis_lutea.AAC.1
MCHLGAAGVRLRLRRRTQLLVVGRSTVRSIKSTTKGLPCAMRHDTADKLVYCHEALALRTKMQKQGSKAAMCEWDLSDSDSNASDEDDVERVEHLKVKSQSLTDIDIPRVHARLSCSLFAAFAVSDAVSAHVHR